MTIKEIKDVLDNIRKIVKRNEAMNKNFSGYVEISYHFCDQSYKPIYVNENERTVIVEASKLL